MNEHWGRKKASEKRRKSTAQKVFHLPKAKCKKAAKKDAAAVIKWKWETGRTIATMRNTMKEQRTSTMEKRKTHGRIERKLYRRGNWRCTKEKEREMIIFVRRMIHSKAKIEAKNNTENDVRKTFYERGGNSSIGQNIIFISPRLIHFIYFYFVRNHIYADYDYIFINKRKRWIYSWVCANVVRAHKHPNIRKKKVCFFSKITYFSLLFSNVPIAILLLWKCADLVYSSNFTLCWHW